MRSGTANLNDALLNLVHQQAQSNWLGGQAQPSATYRQSSTRFWWTENFEGVAMAVLLQLWSRRSSNFLQQFTRRAANTCTTFCCCFLSHLNCLQRRCHVATSSQPPEVLLLTNQIRISLFARWTVQKVKSAFDWSIAMQFGINLHSLTVHTLIPIWLDWCEIMNISQPRESLKE